MCMRWCLPRAHALKRSRLHAHSIQRANRCSARTARSTPTADTTTTTSCGRVRSHHINHALDRSAPYDLCHISRDDPTAVYRCSRSSAALHMPTAHTSATARHDCIAFALITTRAGPVAIAGGVYSYVVRTPSMPMLMLGLCTGAAYGTCHASVVTLFTAAWCLLVVLVHVSLFSHVIGVLAGLAGFWIGHTDRDRGYATSVGAGSVGALGNATKLVEAGLGKPALTRRVRTRSVARACV